MIRSAVTIALVPEIKKGPWIFWNNLEAGIEKAATLGFDAIELFTPDAAIIESPKLKFLLDTYGLKLAAVGTGAGKVVQGLTLTDTDKAVRQKAIYFIETLMKSAALFGAPAIIGSMQGNTLPGMESSQSLDLLAAGIDHLNTLAGELGTLLIYEPLNRYETNLINTIEAGAAFLALHDFRHTRLLADLFHMNIEERNVSEAIAKHIDWIGHVHFADSNRNPVGFGHTDVDPIAAALHSGGYSGYVSAEAFPWPDPDHAAEQTIRAFNQYFK